jgi:hypothetical protein
MKKIIILAVMSFCISNVQAQILKKLKDKVNKTIENAAVNSGKSTNEGANADTDGNDAGGNKSSDDDLSSNPGNYKMAYSSPVNFRIMYDESRLGIRRNKSDYRLILKQSAGNKLQFVIIDNGQVTATVSSLTDDQIIGGIHGALDGINGGSGTNTEKYIVADSTSVTVRGQDSKTFTVPKIDEDQVARGFEMMKKTDEYKKMSAEEKKELEESMKQTPEIVKVLNSNRTDNDKVTIQGIKGGTYTSANGSYSIIIKGKNYGKFSGKPLLNISADEANVYIVGSDGKGKTDFISNDKRITLTSKAQSYMGHAGNIIISPDGQKAVFIEMKTLTDKEFEDRNKSVESGGKFTVPYLVTKSDGTSFQIVRTGGDDKYRLTNSGALVYVDKDTREVFSDGKPIAKFAGSADGGIISDGLIVGNDPSKICYYMDDGSLTYLDGTQKKMGILFPQIITDNGKTYLTWFKKVKNDIYIGKFEF